MKTKLFSPKELILTAGPSIAKKEITYVMDAVKNGWNLHYRDYIEKFEKAFATYLGVKYALTLSSGTAALHLACLGCDIGQGDEVLVPEITFVASANAVRYAGGTPVFVDVEPDTWCMDPASVLRAITKKTKAIMPVHIYGHPANMIELNKIAKEYDLKVIEDACPSIGAEVNGKKVGSIGDVGAYSFQGAKAMVTGEGGMLVTNSEKIYEKAQYYGNHAKDHNKMFWHSDIGFMYRMTNMQAALGLAQLERVDILIEKKRKIFSWYKEYLEGVPGITLNVEKTWAKNVYWMSSVVLDKTVKISRDDMMKNLKGRLVDTRPFFYPISMFPMYSKTRVNNPVAYWVGPHGINLPSGHNLTKEHVRYVAGAVRDMLSKHTPASVDHTGYKAQVEHIFSLLKTGKKSTVSSTISKKLPNGKVMRIYVVTKKQIVDDATITSLAKWRDKANIWFPSQFVVTQEGTKRWADMQLLNMPDRILFFLHIVGSKSPFGHVGLYRFDYQEKSCEIDNVIRGENEPGTNGAMTIAVQLLCSWARKHLGVKTIYLRVFSDNIKAIAVYKRVGFEEVERVALVKKVIDGVVHWVEQEKADKQSNIQRYFIKMKLIQS